jgi:hypothetical protein
MTENSSFASQAMRLLAAASLACTVAAVGCSTDRTPGAGQPGRYEPSVGPTMPSATPGSEQNRPVNPPMTSSYTAPNSVMPQHPNLDALAIAAANQSFRGRYLGVADPAGVPSYAMNAQAPAQAQVYETGQFINPSDSANPEITVNRSISSQPTPVVSSGGTSGGVAITAPAGTSAAITSGITTTPTTAATTLTPTIAANTVATNVSSASAANAAAAVIDNRGGLLTPTMTSSATPSPTAAANPGVGNVRTGTSVATTANTTSTVTNTTSRLNTSAAASGSLVIGRSSNGTVTITNTDRAVTTSRPSAPTLKFQ